MKLQELQCSLSQQQSNQQIWPRRFIIWGLLRQLFECRWFRPWWVANKSADEPYSFRDKWCRPIKHCTWCHSKGGGADCSAQTTFVVAQAWYVSPSRDAGDGDETADREEDELSFVHQGERQSNDKWQHTGKSLPDYENKQPKHSNLQAQGLNSELIMLKERRGASRAATTKLHPS